MGTAPFALRKAPALAFRLRLQAVGHPAGDEVWSVDRSTEWNRGSTFEVLVAPEYLHKANVSGGMPYGVAVP
jgi:hypothetical protein